jgi:hypothetical protein
MATTSDRHTRRPRGAVPSRHPTGPSPRRREDARSGEVARMEQAAIEAGRWLRQTGRLRLPVRTRR